MIPIPFSKNLFYVEEASVASLDHATRQIWVGEHDFWDQLFANVDA